MTLQISRFQCLSGGNSMYCFFVKEWTIHLKFEGNDNNYFLKQNVAHFLIQ